MENNREILLFVYGTLMSNNRKGHTYLSGARFLGKCTLNGYELYDLGDYPGIVEGNDRVKGELYAISIEKLPDIDSYEEEGSLYKRNMVQVVNKEHEILNAFVYVYIKSIAGKIKIDYQYQPWFEGIVNKSIY